MLLRARLEGPSGGSSIGVLARFLVLELSRPDIMRKMFSGENQTPIKPTGEQKGTMKHPLLWNLGMKNSTTRHDWEKSSPKTSLRRGLEVPDGNNSCSGTEPYWKLFAEFITLFNILVSSYHGA